MSCKTLKHPVNRHSDMPLAAIPNFAGWSGGALGIGPCGGQMSPTVTTG